MATTSELVENRPVMLQPRNFVSADFTPAGANQSINHHFGRLNIGMRTDKAGRAVNEDGVSVAMLSGTEGNALVASVVDGMGGYQGGVIAQQIIRDSILVYSTSKTLTENMVPVLEYANSNILAFTEIFRSIAGYALEKSFADYVGNEVMLQKYAEKGIDTATLVSLADYSLQLISRSANFNIATMSESGFEALKQRLESKFEGKSEEYLALIKNEIAAEISLGAYLPLSHIIAAIDSAPAIDQKQKEIIFQSLHILVNNSEPEDYKKGEAILREQAAAEYDTKGNLVGGLSRLRFRISQEQEGMSLLLMGASAITTLTSGDMVNVAYAGDCVAARFSGNKRVLTWRTVEDNAATDMALNPEKYFDKYITGSDVTALTAEEKAVRIRTIAPSYQNYLLSCLGRKQVDFRTAAIPLKDGDIVLLMSDGLKNKVPQHVMTAIMDALADGELTTDQATHFLLNYGGAKPGEDNKSVIIIQKPKIK